MQIQNDGNWHYKTLRDFFVIEVIQDGDEYTISPSPYDLYIAFNDNKEIYAYIKQGETTYFMPLVSVDKVPTPFGQQLVLNFQGSVLDFDSSDMPQIYRIHTKFFNRICGR